MVLRNIPQFVGMMPNGEPIAMSEELTRFLNQIINGRIGPDSLPVINQTVGAAQTDATGALTRAGSLETRAGTLETMAETATTEIASASTRLAAVEARATALEARKAGYHIAADDNGVFGTMAVAGVITHITLFSSEPATASVDLFVNEVNTGAIASLEAATSAVLELPTPAAFAEGDKLTALASGVDAALVYTSILVE